MTKLKLYETIRQRNIPHTEALSLIGILQPKGYTNSPAIMYEELYLELRAYRFSIEDADSFARWLISLLDED